MEKANNQLNAILDGKMKANNALPIVQDWLKLTIYNWAHSIASKPTKKERQQALKRVEENEPLFFDDVKALAREIYSENNT